MKQCPTCQQTYPNDYAVCPRDSTELLDVSLWREGTIIKGKYRILGKLGEGGMGAVYKALHLRFNEVRALKVMNAELARDARFVKRFEREGIIARRLQHPNAVRVDDIDEAEDGSPFIVMEFVEGRSLNQVIHAEAPLPWSRVCSIIKQVAAALDAAHQLGMVHRDIKPENIVLVEGPGGEQAKVLDFGIAKLKEEGGGAITGALHTATGTVLGTPQYMSPEQAEGMPGDQLDGRSDLYSLGMVMYEMLTGALPFKADTTAAWILAHLQTAPTPVTTVSGHLQIPVRLASLVMQLLEKDRERRPPSANALVAAIDEAEKEMRSRGEPRVAATRLAGTSEAEESHVASDAKRGQQHGTRVPAKLRGTVRPGLRAVIVLLVLTSLVGAGTYLYVGRRKGIFPWLGRNSSPAMNTNPAAASPTSQPTLIDLMARVWDLSGRGLVKESSEEFHRVNELYPSSLNELRAYSELQPQDANLHFYLGHLLSLRQRKREAIEEFRKGLRLRPEDSTAHALLGGLLEEDQSAIAELNEAIRLSPDNPLAYWYRSYRLLKRGETEAATADLERAMRLNPRDAGLYSFTAVQHFEDKGDLNGAIAVAREAVRANPTDSETHKQLGDLLLKAGDPKGAIADIQTAMQLNPKLAYHYCQLFADDLSSTGDLNGALALYREAIRVNPADPEAHHGLARFLVAEQARRILAGLSVDQQAESEIAAEEREAIRLKPDDPSFHVGLGAALQANGDLDGAIAEYREAIHLRPDYPWYHHYLAFALKKKGNESEAAQQEAIAKELSSKGSGQKGNPKP